MLVLVYVCVSVGEKQKEGLKLFEAAAATAAATNVRPNRMCISIFIIAKNSKETAV